MTTTPLPAARPSSFTTYGAPSSSSAAAASSAVVQTNARAVGTPAAAMTSLANALDPSSRAASAEGPNAAIPAARTASATPGDQRRLRADHDQVDAERGGQGGDRRAVERVDVVQRRDRGHPRVARGGVHLGDAGVAGQRPGQGVLATAGPDDEGLHAGQG